MVIEIDGKDIELKFGLKFIHELDKEYFIVREGMKYGTGVQYIFSNLLMRNPLILADIIVNASNVSKSKAEKFVEECEDIEALFDDFLERLETAPMTKLQIKAIKSSLAEN